MSVLSRPRTTPPPTDGLDGPVAPRVTFGELVHHHYEWRRAAGSHDDASDEERRFHRRYLDARRRFEDVEGEIVDAHWCSHVEGGVALTLKRRRGPLPRMHHTVTVFHRDCDCATREHPDVARLLHECDEVAIKAREMLGPKSQRVCGELVLASASHFLSLVDTPQNGRAGRIDDDVLERESGQLRVAREYYRQAANREAQMVYFIGMAAGTAALLGIALLVGGWVKSGGIDGRTFFGALAAGALGALVSVMARINDGSFALDYDVSPFYSLFLGALRPVIGAIFGLAVFCAINSKVINAFNVPRDGTDRLYFIATVAFIAGFSERWAQDTLTSAAPAARTPGQAPSPPPPAAPADRPPGGDR